MEEYRDCECSPLYEVSNLGNVRHKVRKNILKPRISLKGTKYECLQVYIADKNGKQRNKKIHRLVAQAFIPNPNTEKKGIVDHIDRNTANNRVENLRWASISENNINQSLRSDNTSGHRGIYFCKQKQKWNIRYEFENKQYHGGFYDTIEDAIANYKDPSMLKDGETLDYTKPLNNATGERNICMNGKLFEVCFQKDKVRHRRTFKTLEDAVKYRDGA